MGERIRSLVEEGPPAKNEGFPSEHLLNKIKDKDLRELIERMLKKKP